MLGKNSGGPGETKLNSLIGKGSNCTGDIAVEGGLKIDGGFKGTISANSLYIGKSAIVEATVNVKTAVIGGRLLGDIIAEDGLELQPKAELIGDVRTKNLIVADTAVLEGRFDMGMSEAYEKRPKLNKEPAAAPATRPVTEKDETPPAGSDSNPSNKQSTKN
jgi:cytoskeletal protein CcmA (bactofilin family)